MESESSIAEPHSKDQTRGDRRRSLNAGVTPLTTDHGENPERWWLRWPMLALLISVGVVYIRVFSAGFVGFDDDLHVYANPFLNPPTLQSVAKFWQQPYEQLYIPLSYTIYAVIAEFAEVPAHLDSSIGHAVSLDPFVFHLVSVVMHGANALLCFSLVRRLTGRVPTALVCALLFALHPLQLESVGWISELRGLTSSGFALLALTIFVQSRQASDNRRARNLFAASALCVIGAMLCKPAAVVLPLLALALDRVLFETPWRKAMAAALSWGAVTLPFALITRMVQGGPATGGSVWWQRPFIAGDALAFYLSKVLVPIDLCVDYGRTPRSVMSHTWGYLGWIVPAALFLVCYLNRRRRPMTWLGALTFLIFLLPTLGLVPFAYQSYSTVADRYAYLALIGVGLIAADALDYVRPRAWAVRGTAIVLAALALLSLRQSRYWLTSSDLLRHTIDVNPDAAFAYNNLGDIELADGDLSAALADYQSCVRRDPTRVKAYINLAEVYFALKDPLEAEKAVAQALKTPGMAAGDYSNLGIVLMKMNQPERALQALSTAVNLDPTSPAYLFNQGSALSAVGQYDKAEVAFRRCISLAPTLAGAHSGLGIVLAETRRLPAAIDEFQAAVRLQPNDSAALDNLNRAKELMGQHP